MFDVSWTDPERETIRDRKSRKENEHHHGSSAASAKSSASSDTLVGFKRRPSILTLLGSSKSNFARPESRASGLGPTVEEGKPGSRGGFKYRGDFLLAETECPPVNSFFLEGPPSGSDNISYTSLDEHSFSKWATQSVATESTWSSVAESTETSQVVQPLSPTSFVTRRTEVTVASREDLKEEEHHATIVHISADGTVLADAELQAQLSPTLSSFDLPLQDFPTGKGLSLPRRKEVPSPPPTESRPGTITSQSQSNSWKPPETWDSPANEPVVVVVPPPRNPQRTVRRLGHTMTTPPPDLSHLQKSVRRMEAASAKIILERLVEEWTDVDDVAMLEELEFEKQLWMRSALRTVSQAKVPKREAHPAKNLEPAPVAAKAVKILSLYDDHASASFLSALHPSSEIHHVSTLPLSPKSCDNIYPLAVPGPTTRLSYATGNFAAIHALSLSSLLPGSSIPGIFQECHRILAPPSPSPTPIASPGILHLTVLDPAPIYATTGPRLRAWLDQHLILPLERQFRCVHPSRLFPIWLADVGLNGEGSTITSVRFAATPETALVSSYNRGGGGAEETKEELKRVIGRMLWEETWGRFIEGTGRWWDDQEVVDECVRMRTAWEYLMIEAVKEA